MRKLIFAALAAVAITTSVGSAFAAQIGDGTNTNSYGAWVNGKPPAFVYNPGD